VFYYKLSGETEVDDITVAEVEEVLAENDSDVEPVPARGKRSTKPKKRIVYGESAVSFHRALRTSQARSERSASTRSSSPKPRVKIPTSASKKPRRHCAKSSPQSASLANPASMCVA
jgi:hypothetical protein